MGDVFNLSLSYSRKCVCFVDTLSISFISIIDVSRYVLLLLVFFCPVGDDLMSYLQMHHFLPELKLGLFFLTIP